MAGPYGIVVRSMSIAGLWQPNSGFCVSNFLDKSYLTVALSEGTEE